MGVEKPASGYVCYSCGKPAPTLYDIGGRLRCSTCCFPPEDPKMVEGLTPDKFVVYRSDGSSGPGEKHEHCRYFVLDLDHDKFAAEALNAYANDCEEEYPFLAEDIREKILAKDERWVKNIREIDAVVAALVKWNTDNASKFNVDQ